MPKVRSLKGSKGQYDIIFDLDGGQEASFRCSEDLIVEYRLLQGRELTTAEYAAFSADQAIDGLMQKAIRYAASAFRSEWEISTYLGSRGADVKAITKIKAKLAKLGLTGDQELTGKLVEALFYDKRHGKERIIFELERRGFPVNIIKATVAGISSRDLEKNLELLFDKKLRDLRGGSKTAAANKMKRYLLERGYGVHDVIEYVDRRQGDFAVVIDEEREISEDLAKLRKKYAREGLDERELRLKLIQALQRKGYHYSLISKHLERGL